jgi:hypothetical protein
MTDTEPLRVTSPTDLLALVPGFFGFHPQDSVVMVTSGALPEPVHCRVDLPTDPVGIEEVAAYLAEVAGRHRVTAVAAIVYTDDAALAEAVAGELAARLRGIGGEMLCAVRADGRHWWVLGSGGSGGLGTPYDVSAHPFMAQAVVDGTVVLGSRRELAASLVGEPGERAEVARCAEEAADRLVRLVDPPLGRPAARHQLVTEGRWVRHRVRRHLEDRHRLDSPDVGRLLVLMHLSVEVRDVAWAEMDRGNARQHVDLWRDVVRRAPLALTAAPAGLLGFAAWLSGHGALAWCAVDRAQEAEPDHGLAALLTHALSAAVPPSVWQPIPADALSLFAG